MDGIPTDRLRKAVLVYSVALMVLLGSLVAAAGIVPLYSRLKQKTDEDLRYTLDLRTAAAEEWLGRARDVAEQITSRTMIRRALAAYNEGRRGLREARAFIEEKLVDAMRMSPAIVGITRLGRDGTPVAVVGLPLPQAPPMPGGASGPEVAGAVEIQGQHYLMVTAPIRDRMGGLQGMDVVLFGVDPLDAILRNEPHVAVLVPGLDGERLVLPQSPRTYDSALAALDSGRLTEGAILRANGDIVYLGKLPSTGWPALAHMPQKTLYGALDDVLWRVLVVVGLIGAAGVVGLVMVLRPLTGRILVHNADLRAQVRELSETQRRLKEQTRRLSQANEELEQLAHAAAHDLQEPLRTIVTHCELLERDHRDCLRPEGSEILLSAVRSAHRMHKLIEDIRIFTGVGHSGSPLRPVDLERMLSEVLDRMGEDLTRDNVYVQRSPLPVVRAHADELNLLLRHLISNAVKYRRGDVRPCISVSATPRSGMWTVYITDNGIGIPDDRKERVFDVFSRLHGANEYPGTGMGLAICRKIVTSHGGDIWIEDRKGGGTTVAFTLPGDGARPA